MCFGSSSCAVASFFFFFFNDTATTEIYTLSLHDALPILALVGQAGGTLVEDGPVGPAPRDSDGGGRSASVPASRGSGRSEEHTSELQSRLHLVCRLLLEKKKKNEGPAQARTREEQDRRHS